MKIIRDGQEIELTAQELQDAFWEQEAIFDAADMEDYLHDELDEDDDWLVRQYGVGREQLKALLPDMICLYRKYKDACDPIYDIMWRIKRQAFRDSIRENEDKTVV